MTEKTETLADAIHRIGDALDQLQSSGLNRRAIIVLIQDATKLGKRDIELVLDTLPKLKDLYCS